MATPRENHAMAVLNGKVYAVGGYRNGVGRLSSVERYDPATNAWEAVPPMAKGRFAFRTAVLGGNMYAIGGKCASGAANTTSSMERFDPDTNAWEAMTPMPTGCIWFGAAVQ